MTSGRVFDRGIASLRGLAVLMLVAYHAIEADSIVATGRIDTSFVGLLLGFVRVPLFAVVAGYLTAGRRIEGPSTRGFMTDRAKRLLIPCISVTTVMVVLRLVLPGSGLRPPLAEVWQAYVFPYEHLWYLPALFVTSFLLALLDSLGVLDTPRSTVATLALVTFACVFVEAPDLFSLVGVPMILPFVLLGFALRRHTAMSFGPATLAVAWVAVALGYATLLTYWFGSIAIDVGRQSPIYFATGLAMNLLLVHYRRPVPWLERVAVHAYPIYLFHLIGISAGARVASLLSVRASAATFAFEFTMGVAFSVIVSMLIAQSAVARAVFLGDLRRESPAAPVLAEPTTAS